MLLEVWAKLFYEFSPLRLLYCGDPLPYVGVHRPLLGALAEVSAYHPYSPLFDVASLGVADAAPFLSLSSRLGIRHTFWVLGFENFLRLGVLQGLVVQF